MRITLLDRHHKNIWQKVEIMMLRNMKVSVSSYYFSYANTVLSSFPSNTLNMCFPLGITDCISHLYMTLSYN